MTAPGSGGSVVVLNAMVVFSISSPCERHSGRYKMADRASSRPAIVSTIRNVAVVMQERNGN